jgi:CheY-like chemotaxis protein
MQLSEAKQAIHSLVKRLHDMSAHDRQRVEAEFGDILLYLIRTANRHGIDLMASAGRQLARDGRQQPKAVSDAGALLNSMASTPDQPPRILIVEDERIVAADLQETLNSWGYDAYAIAATGAEALDIARSTRPDIALTDIRIAGKVDGIEVAAQLRQELDTAVIFVTALADDATFQRAKHSEPYAYLVKPVSSVALKAAIELTARRQRRSPSAG